MDEGTDEAEEEEMPEEGVGELEGGAEVLRALERDPSASAAKVPPTIHSATSPDAISN